MKLRKEHKKFIVVFFFGLLSATTLATGALIQQQRNVSNTEASSACKCTDSNVCYPDGCSRKPKTSDNRFEESRYDSVCNQFVPEGWPIHLLQHYCSEQQPDCCFDIYRYKDDRLCCFQERWTCHPSLCEGSSGSGDCGKYWHIPNNWNSYGCVKEKDGNTVPMWGLPSNLSGGLQPTNPPRATNTPVPTTSRPTSTPRPQATNTPPSQQSTPFNSPTINISVPASTNTPFVTQSQAPYLTPTSFTQMPTSIPLQIPTIEMKSPKEIAQMYINPQTISFLNEKTEKPLNMPKEGIDSIIKADRLLENSANSFLQEIVFQIRILLEKLKR